jgi:hypothetical protein
MATSTVVGLYANYIITDIFRQTPGRTGRWGDIQFVLEETDACDYAVLLNRPAKRMRVVCPPDHVWAIMHEPPNEALRHWHNSFPVVKRIYTQQEGRRPPRYVLSQPALPWFVRRDYDFLKSCPPPEKPHALSWVTSSRGDTAGHRRRMSFLHRLIAYVPVALYGRGFREIDDKWDGLAPYRYSIAVENFANAYYWSEKIADCFLTWTMPIYFGSSRITEYFPPESMVQIDIHDPDAVRQVQDVIQSDCWERNLDAIAEARRRVLDEHQLFPFVAREIRAHEQTPHAKPDQPRRLTIPARTPLWDAVEWRMRRFITERLNTDYTR